MNNNVRKIIRAWLASSSEAPYRDVELVLIAFGFIETGCTGSHHQFEHEDGHYITICKVKGKKVKKVYIQKIKKLLNLKDWYAKNKKEKKGG